MGNHIRRTMNIRISKGFLLPDRKKITNLGNYYLPSVSI